MTLGRRLDFGLAGPMLGLTVVLLLFPAGPDWEYRPLQSPQFFSSLPLFALLYYAWLALLVLLAVRARSPLWGMMLAVIFALVHLGFWTVNTPDGQHEAWQKLLDAAVLLRDGRIDISKGAYFEFPATGMLAAAFATVSGVEGAQAATALILWYVVALAVILFALYRNLAGPVGLAVLGVLLAVQGNMMLARLHFHPTFWGILPIVTFLLVLSRRRQADAIGVEDKALMVLLVAGVTVFHAFASMVMAAAAMGVFVVQELRRRKDMVALGTVALLLVMPLAWQTYWATTTFRELARVVSQVSDNLTRGDLFFYSSTVTRSNAEGVPLWVTAVRAYWWVLLYLGAALIALRNLASVRRLSTAAARASGAILGLALLSLLATVVSPGGHQFFRYIMYGSFLAAPVLLIFVRGRPWTGVAVAFLAGSFFLASFPTMLAHNSTVSQTAYHPSEISAGKFVSEAGAADGEGLRIFGETWVAQYYAPDSVPVYHFQYTEVRDVQELRTRMLDYVGQFLRQRGPDGSQVFVFSEKSVLLPQHLFGVPGDDGLWSQVRGQLGRADRIYDNGRTQVYR